MKKIIIAAVIVAVVALIALCVVFSEDISSNPVAKEGDKVSVYYNLTLEDGTLQDSNADRDPMTFVLGGGTTIKGFNDAIIGMKVGEKKTVVVAPKDGYGEYTHNTKTDLKISDIEEYLNRTAVVGDKFDMIQNINGAFSFMVGEILSMDKNNGTAVVAVNQRHAGQNLTFDIELVALEPAK